MRGLVVALALASLAAGCTPPRDNEFDPQNIPVVRARLVDHTLPGEGGCGDPAQGVWPDVVAASRGRCLAVDARDSFDPQQKPLSFVLVADTGGLPIRAITSTGAIFVLDDTARHSLPINKNINLVVTGADGDGSTGSDTVPLVLLNRRPTAVADPVRMVPAGGWPWNGTSGFPMRFDGSRSSDPDGDALRYCWLFPEVGAEPLVCPTNLVDPSFTRQVPATEGRYSARLVVTDGAERSAETWSEVFVGDPAMWMTDDSTTQRVEAPPAVLPFNATAVAWLVPGAQADDVLVEFADTLVLAPLPDASPVPPSTLASPTSSKAIDAASNVSGSIGVLFKYGLSSGGVNDDYYLHRYLPQAGGAGGLTGVGAGVRLDLPDQKCQDDDAFEPRIAMTPSGNAWVVSRRFEDMRVVDPSGSVIVLSAGDVPPFTDPTCVPGEHDDAAFANVAVRPGTEQAWSATLRFAGIAPPRLLAFDSPSAAPREFPIPITATDLAWASEDDLWVSSFSEGLVRVDVLLLEAGATFEQATLEHHPEFIGVSEIVVDPTTGAAWGYDESEEVVHIAEATGRVRELSTGVTTETFTLHFVDRGGSAWYTRSPGAFEKGRVLRSTASTPVSMSVPKPRTLNRDPIATDPSSGHLWSGVTLGIEEGAAPWGLASVAPDGDLFRLERELRDESGALVGIPPPGALRVSPDGGSLLLATRGHDPTAPQLEVLRLDVTQSPPLITARTTDPAIATAIILGSAGSHLLEPSAPSGDFTWFYDRSTFEVSTLGPTLAEQTPAVFSVPAAERAPSNSDGPWGALMSATNRLCFLTREPVTNGNYRLRYLSTTAAPQLLVTFPSTGTLGDGHIGTWSDAAGAEACWIAVTTNSTVSPMTFLVVAYDENGVFLGAQSFSGAAGGVVEGILPLSKNEAWVSVGTGTGYLRRRVTFPANADPDVPLTAAPPMNVMTFQGPFKSH